MKYIYRMQKDVPEMIKMPALLLIGGTSRKIGKTTLASMVIGKFGKAHKITAVKISNIAPGDEAFHGFHEYKLRENYSILKENKSGKKDSQRMLGSGAEQSYFVRVQDKFIGEAFRELIQEIGENTIIVCESNSLRSIVEPGVFLMLHDKNEKAVKTGSKQLLAMADICLQAHDHPGFLNTIQRLELSKAGWFIRDGH